MKNFLLFIFALAFSISAHSNNDWKLENKKDPMSDKIESTAFLTSYTNKSIQLLITQYKEEVPLIYINSSNLTLGCISECKIRVRIDKEDPIEVTAYQCTLCLRTMKLDGYLLYLIRNAKEVMIELPIYRLRTEIYKFKIEGFDQLGGKTRADWKWPL